MTQSISLRLGLTAGAAGLAMAPAVAVSDPVVVTGRPLSIHFNLLPGGEGNLSVPWDVDGDGTGDTPLVVSRNLDPYARGYLGFAYWAAGGNVEFARSYARGNLVLVSNSDYVTPSLVNQPFQHQLSGNGIDTWSYAPGALGELTFGHNRIAFALTLDGAQHMGWAELKLDAEPDYRFTITRWAYESEPDTPIHVDEVPVPGSGVAALTLLGMGAAGMRQWRKRKPAEQAAV